MGDLISRHGVSAWLDNLGYSKLADYVMDEDRFSSAESEIIRCYDCIHYTGKDHAWGTCKTHRDAVANRLCQGIDYCSWAERREE